MSLSTDRQWLMLTADRELTTIFQNLSTQFSRAAISHLFLSADILSQLKNALK